MLLKHRDLLAPMIGDNMESVIKIKTEREGWSGKGNAIKTLLSNGETWELGIFYRKHRSQLQLSRENKSICSESE